MNVAGSVAIAFPLHLDALGATARSTTRVEAAEQLIEQLLLTAPGERLMRPTLGCGLLELVFDRASDEVRAATQFQVKAALQQWLGDVVQVVSVAVTGRGSEIDVTVVYALPAETSTRSLVVRP